MSLSLRWLARLGLIWLVAIAALIAVGSWFLAIAIIIVNLVALLLFFAARWAKSPYAELTAGALLIEGGFGPAVVIPYDIISRVETRPAGFFLPQHVSVKLRRLRWQLVFPIPVAYPAKRFIILVDDAAGLARELRTKANLPIP